MTFGRTLADTLFRNGRIYTVDRRQPWAQCAAVKGGRFIALGDEADLGSLIGPDTTVVDLSGRMAMPGIVDIHNHILMGGKADLFELRFPSSFTATICCRGSTPTKLPPCSMPRASVIPSCCATIVITIAGPARKPCASPGSSRMRPTLTMARSAAT
jgi:hypothetical protein